MFHGHLDYFQKPPLGGRPNTKPGDHGTPNAHNRWFILFYHVWGPAWIEIHWNSIWLRARSHMTSHYTRGSVTTLHDFGDVCWDAPLATFFWALTISWSRLLARVRSGPPYVLEHKSTHAHWEVNLGGGGVVNEGTYTYLAPGSHFGLEYLNLLGEEGHARAIFELEVPSILATAWLTEWKGNPKQILHSFGGPTTLTLITPALVKNAQISYPCFTISHFTSLHFTRLVVEFSSHL